MELSNSSDEFYKIFSDCYLFRDIDEKEIREIFLASKEVNIETGKYIIKENEKAEEIYIVLEGTLEISKYDPILKKDQLIGFLHPKEAVGEIAFLDHGKRTASVKALTFCKLRKILVSDFRALFEKEKTLQKFLFHISETISLKLRTSNEILLNSLRSEILERDLRSKMGLFILSIIILLCAYTFLLPLLRDLLSKAPNSSFITLPFTVTGGFLIYLIVKHFDMPLSELGVTLKNWKKSVFEGGVLALPLFFAVQFIIKIVLLKYSPEFQGRPLFDPFILIQDPIHHTWQYWIMLNAVYVFLIVPFQEILVRGCLQGLLEKFLAGKHRVLLAILASNLIFGSLHVFFSVSVGIEVTLTGIYIGWLYSRSHNLIGCCLAHSIMGILFFSVFGNTLGILK